MDIKNATGQSKEAKPPFFNNPLMRRAMWFWFIEIAFSAVNFFLLINLVYEPRWGNLVAHQIGMSTRIIYIFVLAYFILRPIRRYSTKDLLMVGLFWMGSWLFFEWGGSLLMGRPVSEIIVGWDILKGYMWPYVLLSYLLSSLIVGTLLRFTEKRL
ncbi:MAG: hypothetical protein A2Z02_00995 [Chloroflexi bacterium RBG_16_48_7]|nr:MAG: hypothetical protein A2Z02_00995 [Chloroflexi bacterium RBG_16_48_7]